MCIRDRGNGGALGSGLTTISNGAVLRTSASMSLPNAISIDSTGGSISVDGLLTSTITGNITGSGALTKVGAGTLELTGTNTFSILNIAGGILAAGAESALGAGSISLSNSGVLKATAGFSTTKTVNMSVNNTNGQVDTNGFDVTFAGTLTGPGNLFKSGAGTLLITGSNSAYAGQTEFPVTTGGGVIETTTINALG